MVTKVIELDLKDPSVVPAIHVTKLDSGLRAFEFHLFNGDEKYEIPSNVSVTFQGTKPDKNGFVYGCEYSENIVSVNCTEQMTAVEGQVRCSLVLVDTDKNRIASFLIYIFVLPVGVDGSTVISDSEIAYSNEVINKLQSVGAYSDRLTNLEKTVQDIHIYFVSSEEQAYFVKE